MKIKNFMILAVVLAVTQFALADENSNRAFNISFWYDYGKTRGFTQIPAGGLAGTTSYQRPALDELGINRANIYNIFLSFRYYNFQVYGGYQIDHQKGHDILQQTLITHDTTFLPATRISGDMRFNLARIGAAYMIPVLPHLSFFYSNEWTQLDFKYEVNNLIAATDRQFTASTARFGLGAIYYFNPRWSLELSGISSIPNLNNLGVYTVMGRVQYIMLPHYNIHSGLFLGMRYQKIKFHDDQTVSNSIKITEWPLFEVGMNVFIS